MHDRLKRHIEQATTRLAHSGVPSPRNDAEVLAAYVLGIPRSDLTLAAVPEDFEPHYAEATDRRAAREPLQHITGKAPFRHIEVSVGPGVFIPRPETELVAGAAIDEARSIVKMGQVPVVVDMFAGTGAIALSVAHEVTPCVVHAVERHDEAVQWLRKNVAGASVIVHHDDVAGVAERSMALLAGAVDVVVANPPYIPIDAVVRDPEVAEHDPAEALWSGADGLGAMRVLERTAAALLRPGGLLVSEHADVQGESVLEVFRTAHWSHVADHRDLSDRPRYVTARAAR